MMTQKFNVHINNKLDAVIGDIRMLDLQKS